MWTELRISKKIGVVDIERLTKLKENAKENMYGVHKDLSTETVSRGNPEYSKEFMDDRTAAAELT